MIRKARESTDRVRAELQLGNTPNAHIVMIERVLDDGGKLLGFVHLALSPQVAVDALATAAPGDKLHVELRQKVSAAAPVVIGKLGGTPGPEAATVAAVPDTRWTVAIRETVDAGGFAVPGLSLPLLLAIGAGLALLVGISTFMRSRSAGGGAEPGGDVVYQGAILNIIEGAHPGLEQVLPGYDRTTTAVTDVSPASQGLDGEDITKFKVPEGAAEEEESDAVLDITGQDFLSPDTAGIEVSEEAETDEIGAPVPAVVFRSYDIRGVVGESLTEDGVFQIGRALGSEAAVLDEQTVIVARDGRNSSEDLQASLVAGLRAAGRDVLDIGLTPTPVLYFATNYLDAHSGVMITGSHNPPEYNGLKMVLGGKTLSGDAIQRIRERIEKQDFVEGQGSLQATEIIPDYIRRISEEVPVTLGNALTVVVDAGNAVPGIVAPHILRAIGHDVIELYCDVDGNFPNHHPDPSQPENIADLVEAVQNENADIGLAFDGDGDRLGLVTPEGNVIWPDRQMILFARDVLSRNPGARIIYDVKCSRLLAEAIREAGGEPMMWKTGHSLIKSKMIETGALLAGEMSGHIFFKERWYGFDDALYAAARLLEILVNDGRPVSEIFDELPDSVTTPELRLDMPEEQHGPFMESVKAAADFDGGELSTIDGLRVDFANGWGLIRASNTTPCLVMRFEGDDEAALAEVQEKFRGLLMGIDGSLQLPF